jgi:disintegrin and metalloproteinase domain-containing protein 17
VFGEIDSHAQVHIDDGVITGSITILDETFHIEVSIFINILII